MGRITGRTITLYNKVKVGTDSFNRPVYEDVPEEVENVLIGEPASQEIIDTLNTTGKRVAFVLGIPKGDTHVWTDRMVDLPSDFPPGKYRVIGRPVGGQEELIPLSWNKKVQVEYFE